MDDVTHIDLFAERQEGVDRRPPPRQTARRRARQVTAQAAELPEADGQRFYARLDFGLTYHVVGGADGIAETTFRRGEVVEITKDLYDHLVKNTELRRDTHRDPELGRVTRVRHPFTFAPPIPPFPDETPDLV